MRSIIPLIPDEELREIRERYFLLLRCGVRVTMASLEFAENIIALRPKTHDGFTTSYLPNMEEHATSLAVRRRIQRDPFNFGDDDREYMMMNLYRTCRDWNNFSYKLGKQK